MWVDQDRGSKLVGWEGAVLIDTTPQVVFSRGFDWDSYLVVNLP